MARPLPNRAGIRAYSKARSTGTMVEVYKAVDQGIDSDDENPWALVCEPHGNILTLSTLALAMYHKAAPEQWCDECQTNYEAKEATQ